MVNDMSILYGLIISFVLIGVLIPYLNEGFGSNLTEHDIEGLEDDIDTDDLDRTSGFEIIKSVAFMFFWTFGGLPAILDAIVFLPLRILMLIIIARNIWIGGGA